MMGERPDLPDVAAFERQMAEMMLGFDAMLGAAVRMQQLMIEDTQRILAEMQALAEAGAAIDSTVPSRDKTD